MSGGRERGYFRKDDQEGLSKEGPDKRTEGVMKLTK